MILLSTDMASNRQCSATSSRVMEAYQRLRQNRKRNKIQCHTLGSEGNATGRGDAQPDPNHPQVALHYILLSMIAMAIRIPSPVYTKGPHSERKKAPHSPHHAYQFHKVLWKMSHDVVQCSSVICITSPVSSYFLIPWQVKRLICLSQCLVQQNWGKS